MSIAATPAGPTPAPRRASIEAEGPQVVALLARIADRLDQVGRALADPAPERLTLRLDDLAAMLGMDRRTIERARSAGRFPRPDLHVGKSPLWRPETVQGWIARGGGPC